ncbi:hypothetical protein BD413DRAFT_545620 [Trametes elegans]|nr:hypothetical protein BD413DRAFT_545620 [Trametes elegans]
MGPPSCAEATASIRVRTKIGTRLFRNGLRDARAHHANSQTNSRLPWRGGAGTRRVDRSFSRTPDCTTSYVRDPLPSRPSAVGRRRLRHPYRPYGGLFDDARAAWSA